MRVPTLRPFTRRELEVAQLLGEGLHTPQIANRLRLRRWTVESYVRSAASKLPGDLPARARLAVWWRGAPIEAFLPTRPIGGTICLPRIPRLA